MSKITSVSPFKRYGVEEFERDVRAKFPELESALNEYQGLLHPQMGVLAEAARSAIESSDKEVLARLFDLVDSMITQSESEPEIANAVQISFLDPEDFIGEAGKEAEALMTPALAAIVKEAV